MTDDRVLASICKYRRITQSVTFRTFAVQNIPEPGRPGTSCCCCWPTASFKGLVWASSNKRFILQRVVGCASPQIWQLSTAWHLSYSGIKQRPRPSQSKAQAAATSTFYLRPEVHQEAQIVLCFPVTINLLNLPPQIRHFGNLCCVNLPGFLSWLHNWWISDPISVDFGCADWLIRGDLWIQIDRDPGPRSGRYQHWHAGPNTGQHLTWPTHTLQQCNVSTERRERYFIATAAR